MRFSPRCGWCATRKAGSLKGQQRWQSRHLSNKPGDNGVQKSPSSSVVEMCQKKCALESSNLAGTEPQQLLQLAIQIFSGFFCSDWCSTSSVSDSSSASTL